MHRKKTLRKQRARRDPLALDRMFDRTVNSVFAKGVPKALYHYTNWAGAEGIISTQEFWATAHDCTNDEAELVSANDIIVEVVKSLRANATRFTLQILNEFLRSYDTSQVSQVIPLYLTSFSALRDDKEQWKKYADNGRGLCLGVPILNELPPDNPGTASATMKVDYSESAWRDGVQDGMRKICDVLNRALPTLHNQRLALSALYRIAAFTSMSAKQQQWEVEQEYRHVTMVHMGADVKPQERERDGKTIRYLPVLVRRGRIAFAEIVIGPNRDAQAAEEHLKKVLEAAGYKPGDLEYPAIVPSSLAPWP